MADRRTVEDLSKANTELAEANKQLTSKMEKINDKLDAMTRLVKAIPTMGNYNRGGRVTNNRWQTFKADPHAGKKKDTKRQQQGQIPWVAVKQENSSGEKEEGQ
eukprot:14936159-Ditylum_brightwellii.AAC.1